MPAIRDYAVTEVTTAATSNVCRMPTHAIGDLLLYFATCDLTTITAPGGIWTNLQNGPGTAHDFRVGYTVATATNHTLTLALGASDELHAIVIAVKDVHASAPLEVSGKRGSTDTTMPFAGVTGVSTANPNCLVFFGLSSDSGIGPTAYPPFTNLVNGDAGSCSQGVAYTYMPSAGSIPECTWFGGANDDTDSTVVAIRGPATESTVEPYADRNLTVGTVLRPLVGLATTFSDTWPTSVTITALGENFEANSVYVYEVAPSYTDKTTDANDPGTADVTWPVDIGDMMYFGSSSKFATLGFITSTAGVTGVVVWEYWNGAWVTAPGMAGAFTSTGGARVAFTSETVPTDWVTNDPGMGQTKYWVRCRITTAYTVAVVQSQIRCNGYIAAYIVATASTDSGTNPYMGSTQDAGSSSATTLAGCQLNFGAAIDMTGGILFGSIVSVLPRDFAIDIALSLKKPGGIQLSLFDTNSNCLSYILGAKGAKDLAVDGRSVWAIDWNGAATAWATCGTISKSAVTRVHLTTLGYYGAAAHRWSVLGLMTKIGIAGGTSGTPMDFDGLAFVANHGMGTFPFMQTSGKAAVVSAPLQLGGNAPVFVSCDLNSFQFPTAYDGVNYFLWNAAANVAGIKFYPQTGDVIKFTNCLFTGETAYRWEFDASSATSGWTGDFSGTTLVGATVTLRPVMTFSGMKFVSCPAFTLNSAVVDGDTFYNTKVSAASPADAADISHCAFTSGGTGHAIEIGGAAASFELHGCTFSGYSGTSTNAAIYVNIASGTMTISITGGGDTPSVRTAGATVTVVNARTVRVTAKDASTGSVIQTARVGLWATTGASVTITRSGSTATVAHTAHGYQTGQKVVIFGANQGEYNGIKTITYLSADSYTFTVSGTPDTPATGTIASHRGILDGDTNSSGIVENTAFPYTSDLDVTGRVRKGNAYRNAPVSGTITNAAGFDATAFMVSD